MSRNNNHKPNILQKARAKFIELYSRVIELSENIKDDTVYWNGENNLYPNEIERVILNSPTGVLSYKLTAKYIAGIGVEGNNEIVNTEKNLKLSDLVKLGASNISRQNGVYFHVSYELDESLNFKKNIDILDYTKTRKGKEFENGSDSRYIFKDFCENKGILSKKTVTQWYWPYTNNEKILIAQIKADYFEETEEESDDLSLMLPFFRGQVYYLNLTPEFKYALSPFDAVFNDLDTEFRISMYINRNFRSGFLGKTSVIVAGLDEEDEKQVEDDVKNWLGSENAGGVYYLSVASSDDIDKVISFKQVKSDLDEKMFEKTVVNVEDKIIGAANNAPKALVKSQDSMFGQSSSTYIEMKKFYTENTEEERSKLEQAITYLENLKVTNEDNFLAQAEIEKQQNEIKRQQEVDNAEQTGADISLINAKYAKMQEDIEATKQANKVQLASDAFGNLASIFGAESKAGKAAAIAQTTIDTYKSAQSAFSSLSGIPIVGPILGAIAAAAAVAAGIANVKKITATKTPTVSKTPSYASGVIGIRGAGGGTSDDIRANLSSGESVINARSTAMFANELSAINKAGGGVGLNGASNIADQNNIQQRANDSQMINAIAEAVALGAEAGTNKGSQSGIRKLTDDRIVMENAKF